MPVFKESDYETRRQQINELATEAINQGFLASFVPVPARDPDCPLKFSELETLRQGIQGVGDSLGIDLLTVDCQQKIPSTALLDEFDRVIQAIADALGVSVP